MNVDRADFDAAFVGRRDDRGQNFFGGRGDHGHGVISAVGADDAVQAAQFLDQAVSNVCLAHVQDQRVGFPDLAGQFSLGTQRDELSVVDDADPV